MADASTYVAPPDFTARQGQINTAYTTALSRLQEQQSQLYGQYGYKDGSTNLDPNNQYGSIQQLLHQTGQSLNQDDYAEMHRGLNSDYGLGAQHARDIRYTADNQGNTLSKSFQTGIADIGNSRVDTTSTYNTDSLSNSNDQANYNSQMSAYQQAQAAYNQMLASQAQSSLSQTYQPYLPGGGVPGSTPAPAYSAGPREYIPTTTKAAKAKPGRVNGIGGHNV